MMGIMPALWTFRHYLTSGGRDEIREWYDGQSSSAKGKISSRFKFLSQNPSSAWPSGYFKNLSKPCAPLGEVRLFLDKVQHRPLTYFSPGMILTFVICAIEKGGKFVPSDACEQGKDRKAEIEADESRCKPSDIPLQ